MGLNALCRLGEKKEDSTNLRVALNAVSPNVMEAIEKSFNGWKNPLSVGTYISCFSEHHDSEDKLGRLSMWRGYGNGRTGVAIVMNNAPFVAEDDEFDGLYAFPVDYGDIKGVKKILDSIASNIQSNIETVKSLGDDAVANALFRVLTFMMICTKHPGFVEEKEWRLVYCPELESNVHVTKNVEVVSGIPQEVYKIPLKMQKAENEVGVIIPDLIDRIIVGPTEYPYVVYKAFVNILEEMGVPEASSKVVTSSIPLRV